MELERRLTRGSNCGWEASHALRGTRDKRDGSHAPRASLRTGRLPKFPQCDHWPFRIKTPEAEPV